MSEQFDGTVTVAASPGREPSIILSGPGGNLTLGGDGRDGDIIVRDASGKPRLIVDAQAGTLVMKDEKGDNAVALDARFGLLDLGAQGNEGDLRIRDNNGAFVFRFDANFAVLDIGAAGNEGDIRLYNNAGQVSIHLDGNAGDITLSGADCAEEFAVEASGQVAPGTVMVIGENGRLDVSATPYDRKVAGVVSGAAELRPGIVLGRQPGMHQRTPIALSGTVYCLVDASNGAVRTGDLLTTSEAPGHAMRASDPERSLGAVVGKALRELPGDQGLIPILVALQ